MTSCVRRWSRGCSSTWSRRWRRCHSWLRRLRLANRSLLLLNLFSWGCRWSARWPTSCTRRRSRCSTSSNRRCFLRRYTLRLLNLLFSSKRHNRLFMCSSRLHVTWNRGNSLNPHLADRRCLNTLINLTSDGVSSRKRFQVYNTSQFLLILYFLLVNADSIADFDVFTHWVRYTRLLHATSAWFISSTCVKFNGVGLASNDLPHASPDWLLLTSTEIFIYNLSVIKELSV